MRTTSTILLSVLFGGVAASATPRRQQPPTPVLAARQSVVTPPPCEPLDPPPSAEETEQRFYEFTDAFLFEQNITRAFEYISSTYINHNPLAEDGPNAALDVLGPIWGTFDIDVPRTLYIDPQGFLNYNTSSFGAVVDRFRWEAGCIVEHWDAGEVFPGDEGGNRTAYPSNTTTGSSGSSDSDSTVATETPVSGAGKRLVTTSTTMASVMLTGTLAASLFLLF